MPVDFITLTNIIFKNRNDYKFVSDEDKEKSFFILNRKFSYNHLKQAQFFNNKKLDKASSIDIWYNFFNRSKGTPKWYWSAKPAKKIKSKIPKKDLEEIKNKYSFRDNDIDFILEHYEIELKDKIKKLKKFKK